MRAGFFLSFGFTTPVGQNELRWAALADSQTLCRPSNQAFDVIQGRLGKPATVGSEVASRIEANPFANRTPQEIDGQVGIDEAVFLVIQNCADSIARIGGDGDTLVTTGLFTLDQRMPQAEPNGTGSAEHCSPSRSSFDQVTVANVLSGKWKMRFHGMFGVGRNRRKRMPGKSITQFNGGFSLGQCGEATDILVSSHQMRRKMACIPAYIVGHDFHEKVADRHRTDQIRRQPGDVA